MFHIIVSQLYKVYYKWIGHLYYSMLFIWLILHLISHISLILIKELTYILKYYWIIYSTIILY